MITKRHTPWRELWERAKRGDEEAWKEVCERLPVILLHHIQQSSVETSQLEREVIVDDTLEILWEKRESIDDLVSYAKRVVDNKLGDIIRSRRSHRNVEFDDQTLLASGRQGSLEDEICLKDILDKLKKDTKDWPELDRIIAYALFHGIRTKTIYEELFPIYHRRKPELTIEAFRTRVCRCKKKLQERIKDYGYGPTDRG